MPLVGGALRRFYPTASRGAVVHPGAVRRHGIAAVALLTFASLNTSAIHSLQPLQLDAYPAKELTMNFIIWLVVGGVIGWLASMVMKTNGQQGIILNVVVGIVGAMLGGWLISPLIGVGTINQDNFSLPAMAVSFVGALILLAIVNFFRRGRAT